MSADQPLGLAYNRVTDALVRGYKDRMYFIDFDDLTREPGRVMSNIYTFLGEEQFLHDFNNVKQVTWEDDTVHGFKGLHDIRSKVEPMKPQWPTVLGQWAEGFNKLNFWKQ